MTGHALHLGILASTTPCIYTMLLHHAFTPCIYTPNAALPQQVHDIIALTILSCEPSINTHVKLKVPHRNNCFEVSLLRVCCVT